MTLATSQTPAVFDESTAPPDSVDAAKARDSIPSAVDAVLAAVEEQLRTADLPTATYRVQFSRHCSFRSIQAFVPYLYTLGVSDLYASPFLQARPGSTHGYDIVNHSEINSEVGTLDELRSLRSALREHDMGLLADVVPNHMSTMPQLNLWWQDVLENGPSSQYASYFDIDWMPLKPDLAHKVLLPVLGQQFGKVLEGGQLSVHYDQGSFWLDYYDQRYPIAPRSYSIVLSQGLDELNQRFGDQNPDIHDLLSVLTAINNLPQRTESDPERLIERRREKESIKRRLHELVQRSPEIAAFVTSNLALINGVPGDASSFDLLDELLGQQAYRLAFWRVAADEINYRRFFDINELAAICTEEPQVFAASHDYLFKLLEQGLISGLRIDHPDGLYDPRGYLVQLQERQFLRLCREAFVRLGIRCEDNDITSSAESLASATAVESRLLELCRAATQIVGSPLARPLYVVVEKILADDESLPEDWPVHGTVGYEFLNRLNGLFVAAEGERPLSNYYSRFTAQSLEFDELAYLDKQLIMRLSMASELNVLGHRLDRISERNRQTRDFTLTSLTHALREVIAGFQVYRSYVQPGRVLERDQKCVELAVARAKRRNPSTEASIFDFVHDVLLLRFDAHSDEDQRRSVERFVGKFQQLTGPIMAKAVEDTTSYRFNRLVSLNEVGGEPTRFGIKPAEFHRFNESRLPKLSHSLNSTSTHDTKRSEDVRARINVLSEIPREWRQHVQLWSRWNRQLKLDLDGSEAPSRNAEYLLYQTLVGVWPGAIPAGEERAAFILRMQQYMVKVVRESKVHTSWISPNELYESAVLRFVECLFDQTRRQPFLTNLHGFARKVAIHGCWNSLSQVVLKIASPGVADFYQGSEAWNLTLVDPDNRRPLDVVAMRDALDGLLDDMAATIGVKDRGGSVEGWLRPAGKLESCDVRVAEFLEQLVARRDDGRIKLFATLLGLRARRRFPELFTRGAYESLTIVGPYAENVVAFMRRERDHSAVVIVPRLTVGVVGFGGPPPLGSQWGDTAVVINDPTSIQTLRDVFSRQVVRPSIDRTASRMTIPVADALRHFGAALLVPVHHN